MPGVVTAVRRALDGGPAVVPLPRAGDAPVPAGTALVVRTSGSTGTPREVALSADAVRASATATHERLGGPGHWVLTLPTTHVAGLQVVVRSVLARTPLTSADPDAPFTPDRFADLLEPVVGRADAPVYASLVPTQLHRLVAAAGDGEPRGLAALARCSAVLLGGAATPRPLLERALDAGVTVVRTYGMSETAGGCVYDGVPLRGVRVRVAEPAAPAGSDSMTGVIELSGPTLATGYLGDDAGTAAAFRTDTSGPDAGTRWFRTSDLGSVGPDGVLRVVGRADDVVITGGVNVSPAAVEAALADVLGEACVVGVPDAEWGHTLVAVVASGSAAADPAHGLRPVAPSELERARAVVGERLGAAAAPRRAYHAATLPLRGPGKVDRSAVADAVRRHEAAGGLLADPTLPASGA